jgi:hypothetical protein
MNCSKRLNDVLQEKLERWLTADLQRFQWVILW